MQIVPAILPKNFKELETQMTEVVGLVPVVQIDICDGVFVKNSTWPYGGRIGAFTDPSWRAIESEEEGMPYWDSVDIELDLMVADPKETLEKLIKIGPTRIVFHYASLGTDPVAFFETLDPYYASTMKIGIALTPDTPVDVIAPLIPYVHFIQCMGIERVGFQGQPFDERTLTLVSSIHATYPELEISVDGAVSFENIDDLIEAGVTRLVIGSALWNAENPRAELQAFQTHVGIETVEEDDDML